MLVKTSKANCIITAILLLSTSALSMNEGGQEVRPSEEAVVRLGTELVTLTVTVTDSYGRLVKGLQKEHFEVFDDKVKQNIEFFSAEDAPVSVAFIYDRSGSMRERMNRSLASLRQFISISHQRDEYCLVTFNSSARLNSDFTRNADQLANSLIMTDAKGSTALYDAVYIGLEKARKGTNSKKAVVILSDGQDNNSRYSYKDVKKFAKESDVMIYAIGIVNTYSFEDIDRQGQEILEELALLTGGRSFFPRSDPEIHEAITRIATELRCQYSLGFTPTVEGNNKWHKLKLKLRPPKKIGGLSVRGREGYFAMK